MKTLAAGFVFAALTFNGCASNDYVVKEGQNEQRFSQDEKQCRTQVNQQTQTERNIDDDRRGTFRGDQERYGQTALPAQIEAAGDRSRSGRLMQNCMEAHGWSAKKSWWQR